MEFTIERVGIADAAELLALQIGYRPEAAIYNDLSIPPLVQSLESPQGEFATHTFLSARPVLKFDSGITGAIGGSQSGDTCRIGRLIVLPEYQRRGLGSRLMAAIEDAFPAAKRYELFTGHLSEGNLRLYRRLGYKEFRRPQVTASLQFVFLEKFSLRV